MSQQNVGVECLEEAVDILGLTACVQSLFRVCGPLVWELRFLLQFFTLSKRKWLNMWSLHDRCVLPCCPVSVPDYELSKCIHLNPNSSDSIQNTTAVKLKHIMCRLNREKTHFLFPTEKQIWHAIAYRWSVLWDFFLREFLQVESTVSAHRLCPKYL